MIKVKDIAQAIAEDDFPKVLRLIQDRDFIFCNLNRVDDSQKSALHLIIESQPKTQEDKERRKEAITTLLGFENINPNVRGDGGRTPLYLAIELQDEEIVELLMDHQKTDPNLTPDLPESPLKLAVRLENVRITEILLGNEKTDAEFKSPFQTMAAFDLALQYHSQKPELIKPFLLNNEKNLTKVVDSMTENIDHSKILEYFVGDKENQLLLQSVLAQVNQEKLDLLLSKSVCNDCSILVSLLLGDERCNVKMRPNNKSLIHHALLLKDKGIEIFELLLDKEDVDINEMVADEFRSFSLLHLAFRLKNFQAAELLLQKEEIVIDPEIKNGVEEGLRTAQPIHSILEGIEGLDKELTQKIIAVFALMKGKGVDFNEEIRCSGHVVLHQAVNIGSLEIARYLKENGAKIDVEDAQGRTPLDLAIKNGHGSIAQYLVENNAQGNSPLHALASRLTDLCELEKKDEGRS